MGGQALEAVATASGARLRPWDWALLPALPLVSAGMGEAAAGATALGLEAGAGLLAANLAFPDRRGSSSPVGAPAQAQAAARAAATDSTSSGFTAPTTGGGGSRYDTAYQTQAYDNRAADRQREADELAAVEAEYARRARERAQRQTYG
jgi:hypothetical protein